MLSVLGEVALGRDGHLETIASSRQRALLAALALERGQVLSTERLAEQVWPAHPPAHPAASLQSHMSRLRPTLPAGVEVTTVADGYRLDVADDDLDAASFEAGFRQAGAAGPAERVAIIERALKLWRGVPYVDLGGPDAAAEAIRLDEMRHSLIELRAESLLDTGRPHEAIADLENVRGRFPLRERPVELLMQAYVDVGRKAEALRVYQELRLHLGEELGLDPAPELRALEEAILREEVKADRVGAGREATRRVPSVALPPSPFLGRATDLAAVADLLGGHRIVTVTGPGGVGKTRLGVQVAHDVGTGYRDGTWLIELAPVRDPDQIPDVVASTLGVRRLIDVSVLDRIVDHIGDRRMLIVLDNCEHLVDQAAELVQTLVTGAPGVSVLATSREALNIDGERIYRLAPLVVDDGADDAVRLFAERAAAVMPGFSLEPSTRDVVAHICRRLDGLPLAIELAAARLATLSLDEVVAGLDERFAVFNRGRRTADERHRSLRAAVEWSCQQLDEGQLAIFARLSVFAGRFTAEAADEVCGPAPGGTPTADLLYDLVERSLLVEHRESGAPTRYGYLETIRAYAADLLTERGETESVGIRHAWWAVRMAEILGERLAGPGELDAARRLIGYLPELRVAHQHYMDTDEADGALRLSAALRYYAALRLHSEVFGWAIAAADRFGTVDHELTETVLATASTACWQAGAHEASRRYAQASAEAAATRPETGAGRAAAEARGDTLLWEGDPAGSLDCFLDAVRLNQECGDRLGEIYNLANAVMCAGYVGEIDRAVALAAQARKRMGDEIAPGLEAWVLYSEGEALAETDPERALELLTSALARAEPAGLQFVVGVAGLTRASLLARRGDSSALPVVLDLIEHWREGGAWTQQWITLRTVVDLLVEGGDHEGGAVLLGALASSGRSIELFGADADRLERARGAIDRALDDAAVAMLARGAALSDLECVRYAVARIQRLIRRE